MKYFVRVCIVQGRDVIQQHYELVTTNILKTITDINATDGVKSGLQPRARLVIDVVDVDTNRELVFDTNIICAQKIAYVLNKNTNTSSKVVVEASEKRLQYLHDLSTDEQTIRDNLQAAADKKQSDDRDGTDGRDGTSNVVAANKRRANR